MSLLRIVSSFFVAGAIVRDGRIVDAAPIIGWMRGRSVEYVRGYVARRGWAAEWVG